MHTCYSQNNIILLLLFMVRIIQYSTVESGETMWWGKNCHYIGKSVLRTVAAVKQTRQHRNCAFSSKDWFWLQWSPKEWWLTSWFLCQWWRYFVVTDGCSCCQWRKQKRFYSSIKFIEELSSATYKREEGNLSYYLKNGCQMNSIVADNYLNWHF